MQQWLRIDAAMVGADVRLWHVFVQEERIKMTAQDGRMRDSKGEDCKGDERWARQGR
jgi:hypothetical protein